MSDRGMKKWLPFSALTVQQDILDEMLYEKYKIKKPQVSIEQARKIDTILKSNYKGKLKIKIYIDGYLYTIKDEIKKIDQTKRLIYFENFYIPINDIIDIEDPDVLGSIC